MRKLELLERLVIKEMEHKVESAGIKLDATMKSILEYLYSHQNKNGFIYMSIKDIILECGLGRCSEIKAELMDNIKWLLCDLEEVVLAKYSCEHICLIQDLDELLILEFVDELK